MTTAPGLAVLHAVVQEGLDNPMEWNGIKFNSLKFKTIHLGTNDNGLAVRWGLIDLKI